MTNSICFIILHFGNNYEITLSAIDSVNQLFFGGNIDFVIVCNGQSCDISTQISKKNYENVSTIVLNENSGFSKGNNTGYRYAKQKKDYDFIVIMNNDVCIKQKDFFKKLYQVYKRNKFYILGPDIYTPYSDFHSSPLADAPLGSLEINDIISEKRKMLKEYNKKFSLFALKTYLLEACTLRSKLSWILKLWRKIKNNNHPYKEERWNVVLQGSCLIFSRDYIEVNDKAFEPEVFLYFEEHYLAQRCAQNRWSTLYTDKLQVLHYHRGSSGMLGMSYNEYCEKKKKISDIFLESALLYKENLNRRE